jgi:hypothetical protein
MPCCHASGLPGNANLSHDTRTVEQCIVAIDLRSLPYGTTFTGYGISNRIIKTEKRKWWSEKNQIFCKFWRDGLLSPTFLSLHIEYTTRHRVQQFFYRCHGNLRTDPALLAALFWLSGVMGYMNTQTAKWSHNSPFIIQNKELKLRTRVLSS